MNPIQEASTFKQPSKSFLLLHTKPADAKPLAVVSIQHAQELNVLGGFYEKADEFLFLTRYLYDHMGPMIVCGVDNLEIALARFGNTLNEFIIPISPLTNDQIIQCLTVLEKLRTGCLYMFHQELPSASPIEYRVPNL